METEPQPASSNSGQERHAPANSLLTIPTGYEGVGSGDLSTGAGSSGSGGHSHTSSEHNSSASSISGGDHDHQQQQRDHIYDVFIETLRHQTMEYQEQTKNPAAFLGQRPEVAKFSNYEYDPCRTKCEFPDEAEGLAYNPVYTLLQNFRNTTPQKDITRVEDGNKVERFPLKQSDIESAHRWQRRYHTTNRTRDTCRKDFENMRNEVKDDRFGPLDDNKTLESKGSQISNVSNRTPSENRTFESEVVGSTVHIKRSTIPSLLRMKDARKLSVRSVIWHAETGLHHLTKQPVAVFITMSMIVLVHFPNLRNLRLTGIDDHELVVSLSNFLTSLPLLPTLETLEIDMGYGCRPPGARSRDQDRQYLNFENLSTESQPSLKTLKLNFGGYSHELIEVVDLNSSLVNTYKEKLTTLEIKARAPKQFIHGANRLRGKSPFFPGDFRLHDTRETPGERRRILRKFYSPKLEVFRYYSEVEPMGYNDLTLDEACETWPNLKQLDMYTTGGTDDNNVGLCESGYFASLVFRFFLADVFNLEQKNQLSLRGNPMQNLTHIGLPWTGECNKQGLADFSNAALMMLKISKKRCPALKTMEVYTRPTYVSASGMFARKILRGQYLRIIQKDRQNEVSEGPRQREFWHGPGSVEYGVYDHDSNVNNALVQS